MVTSHLKQSEKLSSSSCTSDSDLKTSEYVESKCVLSDESTSESNTVSSKQENVRVYDGFSDPIVLGYPSSESTQLGYLNWIVNPAAIESQARRKVNTITGYHHSIECTVRPNNNVRAPFKGTTQSGIRGGFVYRKMSDTLNSYV